MLCMVLVFLVLLLYALTSRFYSLGSTYFFYFNRHDR